MRIKINYASRFVSFFSAIIVVSLLAITSLVAQDQTKDQAKDQFRDRLCQILQEKGWTLAQVTSLREQKVDWNLARASEARIVAYALQYDASADSATLSSPNQARLAIQLALAAREMKQFGQTEQEIAIVAVQATQSVRTMLAKQSGLGGETNPISSDGDQLQVMIRDQIRLSVKDQNQVQLWTQSRQFANTADSSGGFGSTNATDPGKGKK